VKESREVLATSRESAIQLISADDIFHASAPNGASLICLTSKVTEQIIHAQTVTSQFVFEFDRSSGVADWVHEGNHTRCIIDSTAPLPPEMHAYMLELKHKYSTPGENPRLTDGQKRALLFVSRFYPANPLPMPEDATTIRSVAQTEGVSKNEKLSLKEYQDRLLDAFLIPAPHRPSQSDQGQDSAL